MGRKKQTQSTSENARRRRARTEKRRLARTKPKREFFARPTGAADASETYSPSMARPILPGRWRVNGAICGSLVICTLALYFADLRLGFFLIDDPGYVTENPWIQAITFANLRHILFSPYFA